MDALKERPLVIKIFVGKGDFHEQDALAAKREKQGWVVGELAQDVQDILEKSSGAIVVLNGAYAGDCVARLADRALRKNANRVILPLPDIMARTSGDHIDTTVRTLAWTLCGLGTLDDARLTVTPTRVWENAKRELRQLTLLR